MKTFFFQKTSPYFVVFPNLKILWFFAKTSQLIRKRYSQKKNIIWYSFYSKFAIFNDFEKKYQIFQENPNCLKKLLSYVFQKSYCSVGFATIWRHKRRTWDFSIGKIVMRRAFQNISNFKLGIFRTERLNIVEIGKLKLHPWFISHVLTLAIQQSRHFCTKNIWEFMWAKSDRYIIFRTDKVYKRM